MSPIYHTIIARHTITLSSSSGRVDCTPLSLGVGVVDIVMRGQYPAPSFRNDLWLPVSRLEKARVAPSTKHQDELGFEFNFSKVSRQDEGSNSTFQKFPAKTIRIQLFESFPPRREFEFNFSNVPRQDEGSNSTF